MHSKHLIYRDVKPENFLIGRSSNRKDKTIHIIGLYLADPGLTRIVTQLDVISNRADGNVPARRPIAKPQCVLTARVRTALYLNL